MPSVTLTITCDTPTLEDISGSAQQAGLRVTQLSPIKLYMYSDDYNNITKWSSSYDGVEGITAVYSRISPPSYHQRVYMPVNDVSGDTVRPYNFQPYYTASTSYAPNPVNDVSGDTVRPYKFQAYNTASIPYTSTPVNDVSGDTVRPYKFQPYYTDSRSYPPNSYFRSQSWFTSSDLASIYKFPTPDPNLPVVIGIVSYGSTIYGTIDSQGLVLSGDFHNYLTLIGIPTNLHPKLIVVNTNGSPVTLPPVPGGFDSSNIESTIDVCMVGGACPSPNATIILYINSNEPTNYAYMNKILNVPVVCHGVSYLPTIVSISYGSGEYAGNQDIINTNNLFQTATTNGVNICVASGDFGGVSWPATSPYVVSVGGTTLTCPNYIYDSSTTEVVWNQGNGQITGGGYSSLFTKPSYQSGIPGTMRAIPDISLMANSKIIISYSGAANAPQNLLITGGTSASAPLVAAFLACIKPKVFINPILYTADSRCFHDITSGNNITGGVGYYAGVGYDLCSGWGTIVGNYLASVIEPNPIININCVIQ